MHTFDSSRPDRDVGSRMVDLARRLQASLQVVARAAVGDTIRPSRLVVTLGLDKSLASRLSRSLNTDSAYEFLHFTPSPAGLRMFVEASERGDVPDSLRKAARGVIKEFDELLAGFPGGRSSLDALIGDSEVEVRQRAERTASQSVYRAMSYLLGFHCKAITTALILQPSNDGNTVDVIDVSRREGIRRLRPSAPVSLFSIDTSTDTPRESPRLEPLRTDVGEPPHLSFILPEFCDPTTPDLKAYRAGRHTVLALGEHDATIQRPATITTAFHIRSGLLRRRQADQREEGRTYLLHFPCKLVVRDLYIRDDLYVGCEPFVRLEIPTPPGAAAPRPDDPRLRLNELDLSAPVVRLDRGLRGMGAPGAPEHGRLMQYVFHTAGLDPDRFRGYRVRMSYPVPMIIMGWWIPLPEKD